MQGRPGLSPCVWGHPIAAAIFPDSPGSIPMCMGPPLFSASDWENPGVYPHVYGATNDRRIKGNIFRGLSPCVWGHPSQLQGYAGETGSIPMCMGPPFLPVSGSYHLRVYPHVYGSTSVAWSVA